ncbi:hypothetical protein AAFP35_22405 [Gordonia sp. CPCC 206044]
MADAAWVEPAVHGVIATGVFVVGFFVAHLRWKGKEGDEQGQAGDSGLD